MKYVEVVADPGSSATVMAIAEKSKAEDCRLGVVGQDGLQQMRLLVSDDKLQWVLDALQHVLGAQPSARILVLGVEASLPRPKQEKGRSEDSITSAREAIYEKVNKNARLNLNYLVLVVLSTVVAAIGLIKNNIAVVIGAMVIAPLLGPNLALSLGTALGDIRLVRKSATTLLSGILLAVLLSVGLGLFWASDLSSPELMSRTVAEMDSVALALASGAAAHFPLQQGCRVCWSVLWWRWLCCHLLRTLGLMLGQGNADLAMGAGLLLIINIVCVNLASNIVFLIKGIYPRRWQEKEKAKRSMVVHLLAWLATLVVLIIIIYTRRSLTI